MQKKQEQHYDFSILCARIQANNNNTEGGNTMKVIEKIEKLLDEYYETFQH